MLTGLSLQSLAYIIVAISVGLLHKAPYELGIVAVSFLFFYYAAFGCTWGMVPWVYQSEVNSLAMRTIGSAAATSTNWVCLEPMTVPATLFLTKSRLALRICLHSIHTHWYREYRIPFLH